MAYNLSLIQNRIISRLKNADTLRYSELQQEKVPNDLFNYHLQFLVKKGLISKSDTGYSLSEAGIKYVADTRSASDAITSLFKVNVITIVSRVAGGKIEILNQRRTSNPSYGITGVMGGVVYKGERIAEAATRKLEIETGLISDAFVVKGCERRIMYKDGDLFSDVLFPIAYTGSFTGELKEETEFGKNIWVPIDVAIQNETREFDFIESIKKVLYAILDGSVDTLPYFFEETIQSNEILS